MIKSLAPFFVILIFDSIIASRNYGQNAPPPYTAPSGPWYAAPPPAYTQNPSEHMGWVPPTHVFTDQPARKYLIHFFC